MGFWPGDITPENISAPNEVLYRAAEELEAQTGTLKATLSERIADERVTVEFLITNVASGACLGLFETSYRAASPYPLAITPPKYELPDYLKRERFVPGFPGLGAMATLASFEHMHRVLNEPTPGRTVTNDWVCATPAEFEEKLESLFETDEVKSLLVGLLATRGDRSESDPKHQEAEGKVNDAPEEPSGQVDQSGA